ncbi:MAG: hypothetical protein K9I94_10345 [Bacteroidales bacterium]|nr:hypothetical protein [Bacteroidales bacterium]
MKITTFSQFQELMQNTCISRREIVEAILREERPDEKYLMCLLNARTSLEDIDKEDDKSILRSDDGKKIYLELEYELNELNKDIYYLQQNEKTFYRYLNGFYEFFEEEVQRLTKELSHLNFNNFITDRDGTVNNYCGRYSTSIQSAYNGVFLSRFAYNCAKHSVILTSAPLEGFGLMDINVMPQEAFNYAGSKGRELMNTEGKLFRYPINPDQQQKLDELNNVLGELVKGPRYEIFSRIGSGLQFKFGQTTIARQDIHNSIPEQETNEFKQVIEEKVSEIDPDQQIFRIEDTGKDLEIILTVQSDNKGLKDFDKGDGVLFMNDELGLGLNKGPNLICGDTESDVRMLEAAMKKNSNTYAVFVTTDEELKKQVSDVCSNSFFVETPDVLVCVLNNLAKTK